MQLPVPFSSMVNDDIRTPLTLCQNCKRSGVLLDSVPWLDVCRKTGKKYCNFRRPTEGSPLNVLLCVSHCKKYMESSSPDPKDYWPAMIWNFLCCSPIDPLLISMDFEEKWTYIPFEWRPKWIQSARDLLSPMLTIETPPPKFRLASDDIREMNQALSNLDWKTFHLALDKHVSYPSVRCPWGCSEFIHQCNLVPMEQFLAFKSNWCFGSGGSIRKEWPMTTKPSFPESTVILENSEFGVHPCICINSMRGLSILCCRNHGTHSSAKVLHVPSNPLGSLYTPAADQYAQATLQSRTLRRTKRNVFSDTYQTNLLMGGYDGLDTCYITKGSPHGQIDHATMLRYYLYISGRSDVRCHVSQLSEDKYSKSYLPQRYVGDLLELSHKNFPDVKELASSHLQGSTFISIHDAVNLQEQIYKESTQTILVYPAFPSGTEDVLLPREEFFQPPWPNFLVRVHPYGGHGEQPCSIIDKCKSFVAWAFVTVVVCVPTVWSAVAKSIRSERDKIGFLMRCAWLMVKRSSGSGFKNKKTRYFSIDKKSPTEILSALGIQHKNDHIFEQACNMWDDIEEIEVVNGEWDATAISSTVRTVVCASDNHVDADCPAGWQLVLLVEKPADNLLDDATDCKIFFRHGGELNPNWWVQTSNGNFCRLRTLPDSFEGNVTLLVYVKILTEREANLRERYLSLLGGQGRCFCKEHSRPLILNPAVRNRQSHQIYHICSLPDIHNDELPCSSTVSFICGRTDCRIGICQDHFQHLVKENDLYYFLLPHGYETKAKNELWEIYASDRFLGRSMDNTHSGREEYGDVQDGNSDDMIETTSTLCDEVPQAEDLSCASTHNSAADLSSERREEGSIGGSSFQMRDLLFHDDNDVNGGDFCDDGPPVIVGAMGPTDSFDFPLDLLVDHNDEDDEEICDENEDEAPQCAFLTTLASKDPLSMELVQNLNATAPLHVLLNKQGHLLVRQNAKLRMKRQHAAFFQGIIANNPGRTIPLAYAEAMLKPSIYYYSCSDGTIPGALPTALWSDNSYLQKLGIASMRDHITTRIQNPALLCSTDSQYHFLQLDKLINLGLRGNDSRLVLHRGIAESQTKEGAAFRTSEGNEELRGENVEDHSNVHKLAALMAESPPDYFYTQSCNQTTCPGVRRLRNWVTSQYAIQFVSDKYVITPDEASTMLRDSAAHYVHRTWNEIVTLWMKYIIFSPQQPLHAIEWAWYRKEFQDENGNPSHIHAIMKTKIDTSTPSGLQLVLGKIRGSMADLLHYDEMIQMKEDGIVDSLDVFRNILQDAERFLTHRCHSRCQVPKLLPTGETAFVCKAPSNWLLTLEPHKHTMQQVRVEHTLAAQKILLALNLAEFDANNVFVVTHPLLIAVRHVPKCSAKDGKLSPTNGVLFVMMPSASNLQLTTGFTMSFYLTKYVGEVDKVSVVFIRPPESNDTQTFRAEHQPLNNTKISSVRFHNCQLNKKKRKSKSHVPQISGRPITHMECLSVLNKDLLVVSTREFFHMPTCAREYRSALYTGYRISGCTPQDLQAVLAVTGQTVRIAKNFPAWRLFTGPQLKVIKDELHAPLRTDATTYFSMRPPELRFVHEQKLYFTWFKRESTVCPLFDPSKSIQCLQNYLFPEFEECHWMDGFNHRILLRDLAIDKCLEYAYKSPAAYFGTGRQTMTRKLETVALFTRLRSLYRTYVLGLGRGTPRRHQDWLKFHQRFLYTCASGSHLPVVWCTPIYPRRKTAFLVQLLLQKGSFETEYELMQAGNLSRAYELAGLLNPANPEESARILLKRYIFENLRTYPGSTYQFDVNLCEASNAINDLMLQSANGISRCPSVLFSHMTQETGSLVVDYILQQRLQLIDSLWDDLTRCGYGGILPHKDRVLNARAQNAFSTTEMATFYPPPIHMRQNSTSYKEQTIVFKLIEESYNNYVNPGTIHRNVVVCGGPGVGKTTVCQFVTLSLLCKGLNVTPTSLVADRSKHLGGTHFHKLLSLKSDCNSGSPGRMAERAIRDLYRKPEQLGLLKVLDAVNLDELGVFSAENVAIFDMVLRYVRKSPEFMGGLLVYCTMDHLQLLPFTGTPALLSMYVINEFNFVQLRQSVRASNDPALQEIGNLTRTFEWTSEKRNHLAELIRSNCVFVQDFNDPLIPEEAVFVFGRKAPCKEAEKLMLNRMRLLHAGKYLEGKAVDEESSTGGDWRKASEPTRRRITNKIKRSDVLLLYPKARFEFTDNDKLFNQGQLALLLEMPHSDIVSNQQPIQLWRSPTGEKNFPASCDCVPHVLRQKGWKPIKVPFCTSRPFLVSKGIQARRSQYPLRPRIASTIHSCMGSTLSSIVTALVPSQACSLDFSLWEAAQVVVLLSRTEYANRIFFVGDRESTIRHILDVLDKPHRFLPQIAELLDFLFKENAALTNPIVEANPTTSQEDHNAVPTIISPHLAHVSFFRPCDSVIGQTKCVYILVSTRDTSFSYIGTTQNMGRRLVQHNTANGAIVTANPALMPWAVMAYIVGFRDQRERFRFEALWKVTSRRRHASTMDEIIGVASDLVTDINVESSFSQFKLRLIICGKIVSRIINNLHDS